MNLFKNLALVFLFLSSCSSLIAQKNVNSKLAGTWHIKDVFYLNETQNIGIAEYKPLRDFVILVNNDAKVEWEARIDEFIWGVSKFKGNILAFYRKFGELHMATLDTKSGKILDDKIIYNGTKQQFVTVQNDPSGNFDNLLIRSPFVSSTPKTLTLITLAENGNPTIKEIPSMAIGASYIGNSMAKDGHFFIASIVNNSVVVEQFNHEAVLENKLEKPLECRKKFSYSAIMHTDNYNNNSVVISLKYENPDKDNTFSYFNFNFENKQVTIANEKPLNKESEYKFNNRDYLAPTTILFTNDKIIFVKEVNYLSETSGSSVSSAFCSESAVVSVYDKQMHLLHDVVLEKGKSRYPGPNLTNPGCHIYNNKLFFLTNEPGPSAALNGRWSQCYTIDMSTGKWEKKKAGSYNPSAGQFIPGASTFWLNNECIVSYLSFDFGDYKTVLEKISYNDL